MTICLGPSLVDGSSGNPTVHPLARPDAPTPEANMFAAALMSACSACPQDIHLNLRREARFPASLCPHLLQSWLVYAAITHRTARHL